VSLHSDNAISIFFHHNELVHRDRGRLHQAAHPQGHYQQVQFHLGSSNVSTQGWCLNKRINCSVGLSGDRNLGHEDYFGFGVKSQILLILHYSVTRNLHFA
jgi:hypothetical protein